MSTVKCNTLSNGAGTLDVPVDTVVQGSAKAWVNFDGTGTVAIRAAFNVSSITDGGVGIYTANFAIAFPDTSYYLALSVGSVDTVAAYNSINESATRGAGSATIRCGNGTTALADFDSVNAGAFR